ncbi:MAG TPA: TetR/AcrR family transcriptional regulator [bacterium (Candidatus Stahlbacteria)]|nr:TetR/AcrR family transcriptional regulator [Candidatus Stahlbacteria bacterium]
MKVEKRDIILKVAQNLFARYGLKKTTVDEIARDARVSKGTIYHYFKSKEDIFSAVVERESKILKDKIKEAIEKEDPPQKKLRAFVLTKIHYMRELVNLYNVTKDIVTEVLPQLETARKSYFDDEIKIVKEILTEGVEKRIFTIKKIDLTALAMISALKGLEYPWVMHGKSIDIEESIDALLEILFKGIQKK